MVGIIQGLIVGLESGVVTSEKKVSTFQLLSDMVDKIQAHDRHFSIIAESLLEMCEYFHEDSDFGSLASLVHQKVIQLVPTADKSQFSDATIIGRIKWCTDKPLKLSSASISRIIDQLIPLKYTQDLATKFFFLSSFDSIHTLKNAPFFLSVLAESQSPLKYIIHLHDLFGETVKASKMELVVVKDFESRKTVVENILLEGPFFDAGLFNLLPSRYIAEFAAFVGDKRANLYNSKHIFAVRHGKLFVKDVKFWVSDSKTFSASGTAVLQSENSLTEVSASALSLELLHLEYVLSGDIKPELSAVIISNGKGVIVKYGVSTSSNCDDSGCKQRISIDLGEDVEKFHHASGNYQLTIFVGDQLLEVPLMWQIGTVFLKFPARTDTKLALYARSLLHSSDVTLHPLPEIEHVMRAPSKRASNSAAFAFTVLVVLPLLTVIFYWLRTAKLDFGSVSFSAVGIMACWFSLLALYSGYWFSLDGFSFYDTIKYLCFLGPLTVIVGSNVIQSKKQLTN